MTFIDLNWRNFLEKGDDSSFALIYNNHVDDLFSYGTALGFQKELCKDAIQDTFYKLYVSKDNLHHIKNITAYLFKSFKHRLIDLSLKNRREEVIGSITGSGAHSVTEIFTLQVTVLDNIIDSENAEILKRKVSSLLNGLTANQREVVYLKYMIGLEHKEIADMLDIREESARKLLYRTMEKLRQQVSGEDFPEGLCTLLFFFLLH